MLFIPLFFFITILNLPPKSRPIRPKSVLIYCCEMRKADNTCMFVKGTGIIIANHGERIDIPSGSILENKIVSGNLRILDH